MLRIWYIVLLVCCHNLVNGQSLANQFSLDLGGTISTQAYNRVKIRKTVQGHHNILSGYVRLTYERKLKKNMGVSIGIQHIEKGYKYSGINIGTPTKNYDLTYEYRLNYVEVPLCFAYKLNRFGFTTGTIVSYLYAANYRYNDVTRVTQNGITSVYATSYSDKYPNDRYRKWDIGVLLGVSYKLNKYLDVECSLSKHFTRTDKVASQYRYNDIMYNQVYMLGLKYKFVAW